MLLLFNFSDCFIFNNIPRKNLIKLNNNINCNERTIYTQYLLGLRKTRRYFKNYTNIENVKLLLNFTNDFLTNYTINNTFIDNQNYYTKKIIMGNINLDVSNIKEIYIYTSNNTLFIELDKKKDILSHKKIIKNINSIDNIITFITILSKTLNIH